jgi:hypothetical protein
MLTTKRRFCDVEECFSSDDDASRWSTHDVQPRSAIQNCDAALQAWSSVAGGCTRDGSAVSCLVAGCGQAFSSVADLARHSVSHLHRCAACGEAFLSSAWATQHAEEQHSTLFAALAARQPMFMCWVDGCDRRFSRAVDRRRHLTGRHQYPAHMLATAVVPHLAGRDGHLGGTEAIQSGSAAAMCTEPDLTRDCPASANVAEDLSAARRAPARLPYTRPSTSVARPPCRFFGTATGCMNGAACRFAHDGGGVGEAGAGAPHSTASGTGAGSQRAPARGRGSGKHHGRGGRWQAPGAHHTAGEASRAEARRAGACDDVSGASAVTSAPSALTVISASKPNPYLSTAAREPRAPGAASGAASGGAGAMDADDLVSCLASLSLNTPGHIAFGRRRGTSRMHKSSQHDGVVSPHRPAAARAFAPDTSVAGVAGT